MEVYIIMRTNDELYEDNTTEIFEVYSNLNKAHGIAMFLSIISRFRKYLSNIFAIKKCKKLTDWFNDDYDSIFYQSDEETWSYWIITKKLVI